MVRQVDGLSGGDRDSDSSKAYLGVGRRTVVVSRTRNCGSPSLPLVASGGILWPERFIEPWQWRCPDLRHILVMRVDPKACFGQAPTKSRNSVVAVVWALGVLRLQETGTCY